MSEGPIKRERDAWKPVEASTPDVQRVCMGVKGRGYCGRRSGRLVGDWAAVSCADCIAARRADEEGMR